MSSAAPNASAVAVAPDPPTLWGLAPVQIHDRFWAARGVQVVRLGERSQIVASAELHLLCDSRSLVMFPLRELVETLNWLDPELLILRLEDEQASGYQEVVRRGEDGEFLAVERLYRGTASRLARVALTPEVEIARIWQNSEDLRSGWKALREQTAADRRHALRIRGRWFDRESGEELAACVRAIVEGWGRPDATIPNLSRVRPDVWAAQDADVEKDARFIGPVWVGAGRVAASDDIITGPAVLWDAPGSRPAREEVEWQEIEHLPQERLVRRAGQLPLLASVSRRLFDVLFSLAAILLTLPIYPFVILAILFEDGWPVFFVHRRETRGGREFPCLKFRSMRKDADRIKADFTGQNLADGPQFFIRGDPRLTRVGRFIRKTQIDELPQFFNVLAGHMSVVGPRPSPHAENQYSPAWREARLSVKPGITGLWQVKRTRQPGLDFQEWIRFDLEYVRKRSIGFDLWIILRTIALLVTGRAAR